MKIVKALKNVSIKHNFFTLPAKSYAFLRVRRNAFALGGEG